MLALKYKPKASISFNGWIVFHFLSHEDVDNIMKVPWVKGRGILTLQIWKVGFDPLNEVPERNLVWEKLSRFWLDLWSMYAIRDIANRIRNFCYWDEGCFTQLNRRMA